jgi:hypothetical protein
MKRDAATNAMQWEANCAFTNLLSLLPFFALAFCGDVIPLFLVFASNTVGTLFWLWCHSESGARTFLAADALWLRWRIPFGIVAFVLLYVAAGVGWGLLLTRFYAVR